MLTPPWALSWVTARRNAQQTLHSGKENTLSRTERARAAIRHRTGEPVLEGSELLVYANCPLEHRVSLLALIANGLQHACGQRIELALDGGLSP